MLQRLFTYTFFIVFFIFTGCSDPVPVREMALARQAISKAEKVRAEKYAPNELSEAKKELYSAHDLSIDGKVKEAAETSVKSQKKAQMAYEKSLPLLAKDTIEIAEKSLESASEAYANKLAEAEFSTAQNLLQTAHTMFENKQYYISYVKAVEADTNAKAARATALSKKDILQDAITEIEITLAKAKEFNVGKYSLQKFKLAQENVAFAREFYNSLELKKGFSAIEVAKINADDAYSEAASAYADDKILQANAQLKKAEKSKGATVAADDLAASKESLLNARSMKEQAMYKESVDYSLESLKFSALVLGTKDVAVTDTIDPDPVKTDGIDSDSEFTIHTVRSWSKYGDCLWYLARKYYNNPRKWKIIYRANKDRIKDPNFIRPGWKIKIPKKK